MSRTKEILISLLAIIVLILAITTNVFASADDIFAAYSNNNTNTENKVNNVVNNSANKAVNNNARVSNAEEHADAGVDYSIVFIIAVCGVSAIYAYKKIRDYNV